MLDRIPTSFDIYMARMAWEQDRATCDDLEILKFSDPMGGMYQGCGCDDTFGLGNLFD